VFPVLSRDVTTKLSLGGNNDVITELFLPRWSLVSDVPAGDRKLVNLFYGVCTVLLTPGFAEHGCISCMGSPLQCSLLTINVPVVNMGRDEMILMLATFISRAYRRGGP
jgi:hypothetical protein